MSEAARKKYEEGRIWRKKQNDMALLYQQINAINAELSHLISQAQAHKNMKNVLADRNKGG